MNEERNTGDAFAECSKDNDTMKVRDSGMPGETYWETLFDVPMALTRLGVDKHLCDVVELGCGYGTFSLPVAQRIAGTLTAVDINPEMVRRTTKRASAERITNLRGAVRDVMKDGFGVVTASQDAVLLFNILHCEQPITLLAEARVSCAQAALCW